jgi:hypothetical protein
MQKKKIILPHAAIWLAAFSRSCWLIRRASLCSRGRSVQVYKIDKRMCVEENPNSWKTKTFYYVQHEEKLHETNGDVTPSPPSRAATHTRRPLRPHEAAVLGDEGPELSFFLPLVLDPIRYLYA